MGHLDPNRRERSNGRRHPYLTDELDALRADNGGSLRELPDNLVSDDELTTPVDPLTGASGSAGAEIHCLDHQRENPNSRRLRT